MLACCVATFSRSTWSEQAPPELQSQDKTAAKPTDKSSEQNQAHENSKTKPAPKLPAQIELLETRVRFEVNGDSRKEVHARVHINDELGVRQFARLNFNYNRAFQSVEIPLAHITHANGGTSDVLPSAIADNPDPAVVNFPAYQDVRVKSIRILGLAPNDIFEYRVITTTTHHPLAPDFWFEHTFDRSGVVSKEIFEMDLPASRFQNAERVEPASSSAGEPDIFKDEDTSQPSRRSGWVYISKATPPEATERDNKQGEPRIRYLWDSLPVSTEPSGERTASSHPEVVATTFSGWSQVANALSQACYVWAGSEIYTPQQKKASELALQAHRSDDIKALYNYVSQKIKTVDLPLGATGFRARLPSETLSSGYGTPSDKAALLIALVEKATPSCGFVMNSQDWQEKQIPRPAGFEQVLVHTKIGSQDIYLDPALEVAPFGMVRADLRDREILLSTNPAQLMGQIIQRSSYYSWQKIPQALPFAASQRVTTEATARADGALVAKLRYFMRGDNELVLRVALHQTPKEKWKEVAQLLALSDGFRGQIGNVSAADPYETREPIWLEYEITQPKFLDWTKKPLRIPAILPLVGLPDPAAKPPSGAAPLPIELGTPLDVEVSAVVHLPQGTGAEVPAGTSIQRDFATYESHYGISNGTLTASRHINFILKEIPADRAAEYNAFLHAVQNDESQLFTLEPPESLRNKPASDKKPSPTTPKQ